MIGYGDWCLAWYLQNCVQMSTNKKEATLNTRLAKFLSTAAAAAAVTLAVVAPVQAAVYRGSFDPAYGPAYPTIGYRGFATFNVPNACLVGSFPNTPGFTKVIDSSDPCALGAMSLVAAEVDFYLLSDVSKTTIEALVFAPPGYTPDPVSAAYISHNPSTGLNEVTGIDAVLFGPRASTTLGGHLVEMAFNNTAVSLIDYAPGGPRNASNPATFQEFKDVTPTTTTSTVPEPATVGLVLAGLAAAGLMGRRRSA